MRFIGFLFLLAAVVSCSPQSESNMQAQPFNNVLIYPTAKILQPFQLEDENGELYTNANIHGKWTLFFMGYTHCPDICPTTLMDLNRVYPELAKLAEPVEVVLVTADPKRDTAERLKQYINFFNPDFKAIRADHAQLFPFSRQLNLVYALAESDKSDYLVNHSASIALTNPKGALQAIIKPDFNTQPAKIDYQQIVKVIDSLIKN
ncbi:electron transport protein SCO1/SenC [Catenovulum agarivorans DS-2]|uniref:Electron transport protein SCO1/SenC n=1 Tax=Catenovulum agarivorans DS-2 TaxID=1328313 RepID=W7QTF1_9ALTE|nr:SCO family protein [Catenovulum agarivorans]EWH08700.1 electron transport protein SCO1/SenC [Catenovulum agarivorans DS-2]